MLCSCLWDDVSFDSFFSFKCLLSMITSDYYEIDEEEIDELEYTIDLNCTQYIDVWFIHLCSISTILFDFTLKM